MRRLGPLFIAALSICATAAPAQAATPQFSTHLGFKYQAKAPKKTTGFVLTFLAQDPGSPTGPPALTSASLRLDAGTRLNPGQPPRCPAAPQSLKDPAIEGTCRSARVGTGRAKAVATGGSLAAPTAIGADVSAYNTGTGLAIVIRPDQGTAETTVVAEASFGPAAVSITLPAWQPVPGAKGALAELRLRVDERGRGRPYIRTPGTCRQPMGVWTTGADLAFDDGSAITKQSLSVCRRVDSD